MEVIQYIALAMGLAWVSGVNLYATVAVLGLLGATGHMALPEQLTVLQNEGVIMVACFMYFVEFFADKTPGIDTGWDVIHTFIRIPAGAILAAEAIAPVSQEAQIIAFLLGGAVSAAAHGVKTVNRAAINMSPEPFTNWGASVAEDVAVLGALWATFNHPYLMIAFVIAFFIFALWLTPKIWRQAKRMAAKVKTWFEPESAVPNITESASQSEGTPPPPPAPVG